MIDVQKIKAQLQADLHGLSTPALKDKRLWALIFFAAVLLLNHRLGLELTDNQLLILLGAVTSYVGTSAVGEIAKLKAVINAPTDPGMDVPAGPQAPGP